MKRILIAAFIALVAAANTAGAQCKPEKVIGPGLAAAPRTPYCQTFNRVLDADTVYVLTGLYYVEPGFTLTIEPGTVIKGDKNSSATLIVTKGAQIFAQGTQQRPIVFTSNQPAGARAPGDWGGIVVLGDAPCNKVNPLIEGGLILGSCSGGATTYGGNDPSDDSGVLSYIRIEYPGFRFALNNEVNGLTLGGVGSGTQIDHIQVSYSFDDSYEWFGGTVDAKYLVAFGGTDDEFDTDFGYQGKVQFGFALRDPDNSDPTGESNGFESDNDGSSSSTAVPYTRPIFCNMTVVGPERTNAYVPFPLGETFQYSAVLRRSTQTNIFNSAIIGYPWGISLRDATTQNWANTDSLQIRNTYVQGTLTPTGSTHIHDETRWSSVDTWFTNGAFGNTGLATGNPDNVLLNDLDGLNYPDARPAPGSPLIGTANFANPRLAGLVNTSYRGAFPAVADADSTELWTYYWTEFDPQNADYSCGLTTDVNDRPQYAASLAQNHPNPFNPTTTIDFVVPASGLVSLEVFDVRGAKVATLVNEVKQAGKYSLPFNADGLASGVYFYRYTGNGFTEMHKMVLLK